MVEPNHCYVIVFFFINDTATTEIYTLSLHDALPISDRDQVGGVLGKDRVEHPVVVAAVEEHLLAAIGLDGPHGVVGADRKSTRLNSSHANISYAVFCLKKKKKNPHPSHLRYFVNYFT